jgi:hypothetical protein
MPLTPVFLIVQRKWLCLLLNRRSSAKSIFKIWCFDDEAVNVCWYSFFEQAMQHFHRSMSRCESQIRGALQHADDLKLELAILLDAMLPFVQACYNTGGCCRVCLTKLRSSKRIRDLIRQSNLTAVACEIVAQQHAQQRPGQILASVMAAVLANVLIITKRACVEPCFRNSVPPLETVDEETGLRIVLRTA